ncbi:hypothetical protein M405DRAFT_280375 [Rhizopogon salebrosus TDB-379]|nr:hypothetical protein M405DRAFT_280375 [Rhizopogon salebrosus TDB-379]
MDSVLRHRRTLGDHYTDVLIQSETSQPQRDVVISYVAQNASEFQAMISEKSHQCNASAYPRKPTKRCNLRSMPEKNALQSVHKGAVMLYDPFLSKNPVHCLARVRLDPAILSPFLRDAF